MEKAEMSWGLENRAGLAACDREITRLCQRLARRGCTEAEAELVRRAYNTARRWHAGQMRKSGDVYLTHLVYVAGKIARVGLSPAVVAAALLHDLAEDTGYGLSAGEEKLPRDERLQKQLTALSAEFGDEVSGMVDAVTEIRADLSEFGGMDNRLWQDMPTYKKLYETDPKYRDAYYIKFVDRLHNLSDRRAMKPAKMLLKSAQTKRLLVPLALGVGAHEFFEKLSDLCFQIDDEGLYERIRLDYRLRQLTCAADIEQTEKQLRAAFFPGKEQESPAEDMVIKPLTPFAIREERKSGGPARSCISFSGAGLARYPLENIFIIFKEGVETADMLAAFLAARRGFSGLELLELMEPTREDCLRLAVQDERCNLYQLFLLTRGDYLRYLYGDIRSAEPPRFVNNPYRSQKTIAIRKPDGTLALIPEGSTVLDFAFSIHERVGLHTYGALINGAETAQLDFPLADGMQVTVLSDYDKEKGSKGLPPEGRATLEWFVLSNNPETHMLLLKHFEKHGFNK